MQTTSMAEERRNHEEEQNRQKSGKGTDRSAPDRQSDRHQEVHPDDVNAPDSNTGHQEVHPDDVEA